VKCSVFIATSADGYIATNDGDIDWLQQPVNLQTDKKDKLDMGFSSYINSVDCMIMGRNSMEKIASFNLNEEQWFYGDLEIFALSNSLNEVPDNLRGKVKIHQGDIPSLLSTLEARGFQHAYIDGGKTITSFLNLGLINEMTITLVPIILGEGIRLFGKTNQYIRLVKSQAEAYTNDFIQVKYNIE
jgi:dihydrofolate reductase